MLLFLAEKLNQKFKKKRKEKRKYSIIEVVLNSRVWKNTKNWEIDV